MGFFEAAYQCLGRQKGPHLYEICYTHPTMMKLSTVILYLNKIQKMYEPCDTLVKFCWHQHFFTRNQQILLYQEIQIRIAFWDITSNFLTFLESLKIVLINMVTNLMMSAKMATLGLLKTKLFWNNGYDVIISVHEMREVIIISIL